MDWYEFSQKQQHVWGRALYQLALDIKELYWMKKLPKKVKAKVKLMRECVMWARNDSSVHKL